MPRPATKPRKSASQERSRSTVAALIEATARILVREGYDKASTNRIAEVAGVSIGSLYQYFPGKEALVVAVAQSHALQVMQVVDAAMTELPSLPVEDAVRKLVAVAIEAHRIDPELHCVLAEQIPRTALSENVDAANREAHDRFRAYLETHRNELGVANLDLAAFVCATSIEALAHNAVLHHGEMCSDSAVQSLIDETTRLIIGFLRPI